MYGSWRCAQCAVAGGATPANGAFLYQHIIQSSPQATARSCVVEHSALSARQDQCDERVPHRHHRQHAGVKSYSGYHSGQRAVRNPPGDDDLPDLGQLHQWSGRIFFDANGTYYVDSAMLVVGASRRTRPLHPADDLARCLRYYEVMGGNGGDSIGLIWAVAASQAYTPVRDEYRKLSCPQRRFLHNSNSSMGWNFVNCTLSGSNLTRDGIIAIGSGASGLTVGQTGQLLCGDVNAKIMLEANP